MVTICENLRLLLVESCDSTQLKLVCNRNQVSVSESGTEPISSFGRGPFTNYVYKRRGVGGQKNRLFVNFYTIENVNGGG